MANLNLRLEKIQRGGATLTVSVILLFVLTLATLIANRDSISEMRAAANDYRHKQAVAAALAGAEYGLAKLSDDSFAKPILVDNVSNTGSGGPDGFVDPNTQYSPPGLLGSEESFAFGYSNTKQNDLVSKIKIRARGCADSCGVCTAACPIQSQVTQMAARITGPIPMPKGAIVVKGTVSITAPAGSVTYNAATTPNPGVNLIRASGTVSGVGAPAGTFTASYTLPTLLRELELRSNGSIIEALRPFANEITCYACSSADFAGMTGIVYVNNPSTVATINVNAPIGSPTAPLLIIHAGTVTLSGTSKMYGYVYGTGVKLGGTSTSTFELHGALTSTTNYTHSGGKVIYDRDILSKIVVPNTYARVAGGWVDY